MGHSQQGEHLSVCFFKTLAFNHRQITGVGIYESLEIVNYTGFSDQPDQLW